MGLFGQVVQRVFTPQGIETPTPTITVTGTATPAPAPPWRAPRPAGVYNRDSIN